MMRKLLPLSSARAGRVGALAAAALATGALLLAGVTSGAQSGANLRITKADSPDPVVVGAELTYVIGVENRGPVPATGVTVTDHLPKDVDLVSAVGPEGPCAAQSRKLTCAIGALAPIGINYGGTTTGVTVVVRPRVAGRIRNVATVKGDQKDPAPGNNKAVASTRVLAPPSCRGLPANVVGTAGDDVLFGTGGPDVIVARGGNDRIYGLAGRDLICAGAGSDRVTAGTAADRVFGGPGADRLLGRGGPDTLRGSGGADVLKGGPAADRLHGGGGRDRLSGGPGADRLRGGRGFDRCRGGTGSDSLRGCER